MFNFLVANNPTAWETDQLMRMDASRFKEFSPGTEAQPIDRNNPESLRLLETVPALLAYERQVQGDHAQTVRYGRLRDIRLAGHELTFRFLEEGRFPVAVFDEFAARLGADEWERNRNHWAIKDGGIPRAMMAQLHRTYDVVLSFAGEDRAYVEEVAHRLRNQEVRVFYDTFEQAALWGANLAEQLPEIYARRGLHCVMFISHHYAEKVWTRVERRAAIDRAIRDRRDYILPCRFDGTRLDGLSPSIAYLSLAGMSPERLVEVILEKLGRAGT